MAKQTQPPRPAAAAAVLRIDLPLVPPPLTAGDMGLGHVEASLNRRQTRALDRLVATLDKMQARTTRDDGTPGGERVTRRPAALRWLLDQIATACEGE